MELSPNKFGGLANLFASVPLNSFDEKCEEPRKLMLTFVRISKPYESFKYNLDFGQDTMELKIKRMDKEVELPSFAHDYDAALDLRSSENTTIKAGEKKIIKTGLKMAIPEGYAGLIWDRSGMAAKHSLHTLAGVIDSGYRGEIGIVMINLSDEDFRIEKNMRIAQMLIQPVSQPKIKEVESLEESSRGENGFGSTGKF